MQELRLKYKVKGKYFIKSGKLIATFNKYTIRVNREFLQGLTSLKMHLLADCRDLKVGVKWM